MLLALPPLGNPGGNGPGDGGSMTGEVLIS